MNRISFSQSEQRFWEMSEKELVAEMVPAGTLTVRRLEVNFQVKVEFCGFLRNGWCDVTTILGRGVWW